MRPYGGSVARNSPVQVVPDVCTPLFSVLGATPKPLGMIARRVGDGVHGAGKKRVHAVLVHNDSMLYSRIRQIIALAAQYSIPTMYFVDECPKLGGLISYGTNNNDVMRQAGV